MATAVPKDPLVQLSNLEKKLVECFSQLELKLTTKKAAALARIATLRDSYKRYLDTCESKKLNVTAKTDLERLLSLERSNNIHYRSTIDRLSTNLKLQNLLLVDTLDKFNVPTYMSCVLSSLDKLNEKSFDLVVTPDYCSRKEPFLFKGERGSGPGEFNSPEGLSVDSIDNVYIADYINGRIQVMTNDGEYVREIKHQKMRHPNQLCIINNAIFITDYHKHRLFKFQLDGTLLKQTGEKGQLEGEFNCPEGVAVDYTDNNDCSIYVCDLYNNRIQIFTQQDLTYVNTISGDFITQPRDVNIHNHTLFVLVNYKRLICLSKAGVLIRELSAVKQHIGCSFYFCFDNYSNILIGDYGKDCIHVFSSEGRYNLSIGKTLYGIRGVTVANDNRIICVTRSDFKIQMF